MDYSEDSSGACPSSPNTASFSNLTGNCRTCEERDHANEGGICREHLISNGSGSNSTRKRHKDYKTAESKSRDDFRRFRTGLFWVGMDQSTMVNGVASLIIFVLLALVVPVLNLAVVNCSSCDSPHRHPFDNVVRISEAALAAISLFCLSHNLRKYGLRSFLFLDQIDEDFPKVQHGYRQELTKAFQLLAVILLPTFFIELIHQVWWFTYARVHLPFIHNAAARNILMCSVVMLSWLYNTIVFIFPCILFRLMCYLQNLRFEGYTALLEDMPEISVLLKEHMRLRQQLYTISHRFRIFIVLSLVTITMSQFSSLLLITTTAGPVNFFRAGDLVVCSAIQLSGFLICLHGAARITHAAQRIVSVVSHWHAMVTCDSNAAIESDNNIARGQPKSLGGRVDSEQLFSVDSDSDMDSTINIYSSLKEHSNDDPASYQKRQAVVTYLHYNPGGITIFGLVLDRTLFQLIFMIELSLVLWILGKTVGIH